LASKPQIFIISSVQIVDVTQEELEVALAERSKPMIIDFYADWCGPCVLLADELKKVRRTETVMFISYHGCSCFPAVAASQRFKANTMLTSQRPTQ
jgi:thiol-disulfide isomerase/thioredoxin